MITKNFLRKTKFEPICFESEPTLFGGGKEESKTIPLLVDSVSQMIKLLLL